MFALLKFAVQHRGHPIYECTISDESKIDRVKPLTSLIIGENGTGKSFLLAQIADFFRALHVAVSGNRAQLDPSKYEVITAIYRIDAREYEVSRIGRSWSALIDGKEAELSDLRLPEQLVAASFMTNDKFTFATDDDPFYKYIGVRASSNSSYTSSIQKRLSSSLLQCFNDQERQVALRAVFEFLGYSSELTLEYRLTRKTLFSRGVSKQTIENKIQSLSEQSRHASARKVHELRNSVELIYAFVERMREEKHSRNRESLIYSVSLADSAQELQKDSLSLRLLEELKFIAPAEMVVKKQDSFLFNFASSGEKHLLFSMLNLIAHVSADSLVLIDEPELSLHPGWQMRYVDVLKQVLGHFASTHCVLATHSHFMVSDLEKESSSLIALRREEKGRIAEYIQYDTYAWSAENVLYKVFQLRTSRNYYFEQEMRELLALISEKSKDVKRIKQLISWFNSLVIDKNDPLNFIIADAVEYAAGL